jgi:hypothetical protein
LDLNASDDIPIMRVDLRPPAVLSVGVTGHRELISNPGSIEKSIVAILTSLHAALLRAAQEDAPFFSAAKPTIRFVTMVAEGADLLGTSAAIKIGAEVAYILPFAWSDYRADFNAANFSIVERLLETASSLFELPGRRDEGARAYERANEVILENIDLLIAVWDGERARGRAGTGDVVQRAVSMGLPVIVIDPKDPTFPTILEAPNDQNLASSRAAELKRRAVSDDLTSLVAEIICPPRNMASRHALRDLLAEKLRKFNWRYEYRLIMNLLANDSKNKERPLIDAVMTEIVPVNPDTKSFAGTTPEFTLVGHRQHFIDKLAVGYGQLFRSSSVSAYLLVVVGAFVSSIVWLLVPWLSRPAIAVQTLVNGLVLLDGAVNSKQRWQERWLEYRVVAQRLSWICLLHPVGLGIAQPSQRTGRGINNSWVNWYVNRSARGLGLPVGVVDTAYLTSATDRLQSYIRQQASYHRLALRRLGLLDARLSLIASGALITSILVAAALGIEVARAGGLTGVGWEPVAILLLTILPATMTAMNGLRAEMDLVRLIERSAQTAVLLARMNRALSSEPVTYDRLAVGAGRFTAVMDTEMREWRFVLESRRARASRRHLSIVARIRRWISQ